MGWQEDRLKHMKKDELISHCIEIEIRLDTQREEKELLRKELESLKAKKESIGKDLAKYESLVKQLVVLATPFIVEEVIHNESFIKTVGEIAYESAGEWGEDNWVQCGHDPMDE